MLTTVLTLFNYSNLFGGQYGQYNENVSLQYDSGTTSNMEYDQNFGPAQQSVNVFSSNQLDETAVPTLSIGRGRTTRSSRGRSNLLFYCSFTLFFNVM